MIYRARMKQFKPKTRKIADKLLSEKVVTNNIKKIEMVRYMEKGL